MDKEILKAQGLIDAINWEVLVLEEDDPVRFYHQTLHSHFALPRVTMSFGKKWYDSIPFRSKKKRVNNLIRIISQLPETASTAILSMTELLIDQDEEISVEAAKAINQLLMSALEARETTVVMLQTAIPTLVKALNSERQEVRQIASELLEKIGSQAVGELVAAVKNDNDAIASRAADVLKNIGAPTISYLNEELFHPEPKVRNRILTILKEINRSKNELTP